MITPHKIVIPSLKIGLGCHRRGGGYFELHLFGSVCGSIEDFFSVIYTL